jgi:hypothetical protein
MNPQQSDRKKDLVQYPIQENVLLEVYWRDDAGGHGPAASLYIHDDEVFRFDCFGGDQGHCHYNLRQTRGQRWYYEEGTVQENIDRSVFELTKNLPFCLMNNSTLPPTEIDRSVTMLFIRKGDYDENSEYTNKQRGSH